MSSAVVYMRVSTKGQDVRSQEHAIKGWLKGNNVVPKRWYVDKITGSTMRRPKFRELQQAIFAGEVSHVIMYGLDRFARSMVDGLVELDKWTKMKVKMTFISDMMEIELGNWYGDAIVKAMVAMRLAFAEAENEKRKDRQREGIAAAKERETEAQGLHAQGMSITHIARRFGIDECYAAKLVRGLWQGRARSDSSVSRTKIDVPRLQRLVTRGLSNEDISLVLKINVRTVERLRSGIRKGITYVKTK